jgi:hypothetical protein
MKLVSGVGEGFDSLPRKFCIKRFHNKCHLTMPENKKRSIVLLPGLEMRQEGFRKKLCKLLPLLQ